MTNYGGNPPPNPPAGDPYYGQQPADPYAQQPQDPYFGQPPSDPYGQAPPDPYAAPPGGDPYAQGQQPYYGQPPQGYWQQPPAPPPSERSGSGAAIVGIFLVLMGVWFLFRDEIGLEFSQAWPYVAVALGVVMVIAAFIPRRAGQP